MSYIDYQTTPWGVGFRSDSSDSGLGCKSGHLAHGHWGWKPEPWRVELCLCSVTLWSPCCGPTAWSALAWAGWPLGGGNLGMVWADWPLGGGSLSLVSAFRPQAVAGLQGLQGGLIVWVSLHNPDTRPPLNIHVCISYSRIPFQGAAALHTLICDPYTNTEWRDKFPAPGSNAFLNCLSLRLHTLRGTPQWLLWNVSR